MTKSEAKKLAQEIAAELFINGSGEKAKRLVLELENGSNGGGWNRAAVIGRITDALMTAPPAPPQETPNL